MKLEEMKKVLVNAIKTVYKVNTEFVFNDYDHLELRLEFDTFKEKFVIVFDCDDLIIMSWDEYYRFETYILNEIEDTLKKQFEKLTYSVPPQR